MTTWYRTGGWSALIERVEVVRETASQVVVAEKLGSEIRERRHQKQSNYDAYFPTWIEARDFLADGERRAIEGLEDRIATARAKLAEIEALIEVPR